MAHFTMSYYEGEEVGRPAIKPIKFRTVGDAKKFADFNEIPYSIVRLTEWDDDQLDAYGVPEILETMSLDEFIYERL